MCYLHEVELSVRPEELFHVLFKVLFILSKSLELRMEGLREVLHGKIPVG